jgi:hypothetical protein
VESENTVSVGVTAILFTTCKMDGGTNVGSPKEFIVE